MLRNFASWILLAVQAEQLHFKSACALFPFRSAFTLAGFAHLRSLHPTQNPLSWILLAVRSLDYAPNSFFKEFSAPHVTHLGALRALPYVLRLLLPKSLILCKMGPLGGQNPLSWILLAVQAEQLHFKSACALFPFRSAFTLAGFAHLRSLHPTQNPLYSQVIFQV